MKESAGRGIARAVIVQSLADLKSYKPYEEPTYRGTTGSNETDCIDAALFFTDDNCMMFLSILDMENETAVFKEAWQSAIEAKNKGARIPQKVIDKIGCLA